MSEILREVKSRGVMAMVGGPLATVEEETLESLADVVFVGEADETWPQLQAFDDLFWFIGWVTLAILPLLFIVRRSRTKAIVIA